MSLRRLSVFPDPLPQTELVRSGPYRLIRHPMYTSLLLATLGWVLALPVWWRWGLWVGLLIVLITKLTYEEQLLQSRFADYQLYQQRTWRLFPWIW
ncbi:methyltransferase family protein [Chloroflexus sp.]|uniref:methyltransferase family protein n=1 Tax=Chloroflexus sp. TaxID=1904827 RepID=UPI003A0FC49D